MIHDISEILVGCIKSGVKKKTIATKDTLEKIEHQLYEEELELMIPETWREDYKSYILHPKQGKNTIECKIIAVADNIDLDNGKHFMKYCLQDFVLFIEVYSERVINFVYNDIL